MHLLILFLISVTAYATSRISNRFPRFQAANFGEMMDGRQLNGTVIKEIVITVISRISMQDLFTCSLHVRVSHISYRQSFVTKG